MGTTKQNRKYNIKVVEEDEVLLEYRILINNSYYLNGTYDSWESAELYAENYVRNKRMSFVITTGVPSVKSRPSNKDGKKFSS